MRASQLADDVFYASGWLAYWRTFARGERWLLRRWMAGARRGAARRGIFIGKRVLACYPSVESRLTCMDSSSDRTVLAGRYSLRIGGCSDVVLGSGGIFRDSLLVLNS